MDKQKLNNEIILCRPAVKKARVAVIRKIIKKIKILKSCQNESAKAKKLRKAEKLYNKVQIMKKLKDDEVTKFALRHEVADNFLKEPSNKKENALASLAKHEAVVEKVSGIREKIPNWMDELPVLLDSLASKKFRKKMVKKNVKKAVQDTNSSKSTDIKTGNKIHKIKGKKVVGVQKQDKKSDEVSSGDEFDYESADVKKVECNDNSNVCDNNEDNEKMVDDDQNSKVKLEKILDPFFIEKKVLVPKLINEYDSKKLNGISKKTRFEKENSNSVFHSRPFKAKIDSNKSDSKNKKTESKEAQIHPSWAAKKVKMIKPFEGKKIKFSDD